MAESEPKEQKFNIAQLPHRKSSQFVSIYSNSAGMAASFFDLQIVFGQITPEHARPGGDLPQTPPHVEDLVSVTMAWEHAKALVKALNRVIADYEREHKTVLRDPDGG